MAYHYAHLLLCCLLAGWLGLLPQRAAAQSAPTFDYGVLAGGPLDEDSPKTLLDPLGNTLVVASFDTTIQVGGRQLVASFTSPQLYVAKLDPAGNYLWVTSTGGLNAKIPFGFTADADGNAYIAGLTGANGPEFGPIKLTSPVDTATLFVAKIDGNGHWRWVRTAGYGTQAQALATDAHGTSYITASYLSPTLVLGSHTLTNPYTGQSSTYASCLARLDSAGTWQWATNVDRKVGFNCLKFRPTGQLLAAGSFTGSVRLGALPTLISAGGSDLLVAQLATDTGSWEWASCAGGSGEDELSGLACPAGGLAVCGSFSGSDARFGTLTCPPPIGDNDVFVASLSDAGTFKWVTTGGSTGYDRASAVAVDAAGSVYMAGQYWDGTAQFGPFQLTTNGFEDLFVAKLNSAGQYSWLVGAGSAYNDRIQSLTLAGTDDLLLSGWFEALSMQLGPDILPGVHQDWWTGFITRLGVGALSLQSVSPASGSPGQRVTLTGTRLTRAKNLYFNSVPASFTVLSPTTAQATVPAGATTGAVSVGAATGSPASSPSFQVQVLATLAASHAAAPLAWPVPVQNNAPLQVALTGPNATYTLHTALGQLVGSGQLSATHSNLPTVGLPPGVYVLTVRYPTAPTAVTRVLVE